MEELLQEDMGQTTSLQQQVVNSIKEHELLSRNINGLLLNNRSSEAA